MCLAFLWQHRNYILSKSEKQNQQNIKKNTAVIQLDEQQIRLQVSKTFLNREVQGLQSCILAKPSTAVVLASSDPLWSVSGWSCHSPGWAAPEVDGFVPTARWWLGSCRDRPLAAAPDVSPAPPAGVGHLSPVLPPGLPTRPHGSPDAAAARASPAPGAGRGKRASFTCIEEITGFTKVKSLIDIHSFA